MSGWPCATTTATLKPHAPSRCRHITPPRVGARTRSSSTTPSSTTPSPNTTSSKQKWPAPPAGRARPGIPAHHRPHHRHAQGRGPGAVAALHRGLLPPIRLLDLAEETSAIVDIGAWVLDTAVVQLPELAPQLRPISPWLSVNVSVRQLSDPGFAAFLVGDILRRADWTPRPRPRRSPSLFSPIPPAQATATLETLPRPPACGWPSTTSAPATPPSGICDNYRWASSGSPSFVLADAPTARATSSSKPSSPSPNASGLTSSPRASRNPTNSLGSRLWGVVPARDSSSRPMPAAAIGQLLAAPAPLLPLHLRPIGPSPQLV